MGHKIFLRLIAKKISVFCVISEFWPISVEFISAIWPITVISAEFISAIWPITVISA